MRVVSTATRVRASADGQLTAECRRCELHLEQVPGADVERALAAFDVAHAGDAAVHGRNLPWGWQAARTPHPLGSCLSRP